MKNVKEYSKKIINLMIVLWFVGSAYGAVVIAVELIASLILANGSIVVHLPELMAYIGAPITGGIVGYLIKSAMENKEKIRAAHEEDIP